MMMPMTSGGMMQQMGGNGLGGGMQLRQIKVVGIPNPSSSFPLQNRLLIFTMT
jgi:hypothetical protein